MIPDWIDKNGRDPAFIAAVIRHMQKYHFGQMRSAKKEQLMKEMFGMNKGEANYDSTERTLRMGIELANQENGALIVSDTVNGYWWAASLEDGLEPAERNMSRARTILDNAKKLVENLKDSYGGQIGLGL